MSGVLNHPPQRILQQLLVDLGLLLEDQDDQVTNPEVAWPSFVGSMPDTPDNCVRVGDTDGVVQGREMVEGFLFEKHGCQIMVRSAGPVDGYVKAARILRAVSQDVSNETVVVVDETGTASSSYNVQSVQATTPVLRLGPETGSRRYRWSINILMSARLNS